jgi:hypothetical protein
VLLLSKQANNYQVFHNSFGTHYWARNQKIELPQLTSSVIDINDWFTRYEKTAKMSGWIAGPTDSKAAVDLRAEYLSLYLSGEVATSYNQFPDSIKNDYSAAKTALCKRYGLKSADAYRRFIASRYAPGASLDGHVDELRRLCDCITNMPSHAKDRCTPFLWGEPESQPYNQQPSRPCKIHSMN